MKISKKSNNYMDNIYLKTFRIRNYIMMILMKKKFMEVILKTLNNYSMKNVEK